QLARTDLGVASHRNRPEVWQVETAAEAVVLVAMELQHGGPDRAQHLAHLFAAIVLEQRYHIDQWRDRLAHRPRFGRRHPAAAVPGENEADRVHAQLAGQADIAGTGHAAELDAGTEQRTAHSVTSSGNFHCAGYSGPTNTR